MLIQPILFPSDDLIEEPELFFDGTESKDITKDKVVISAGSTLSLGTYFNAFSIGKWLEYTKLDNLSLSLKIQGDVEIKAYHAVGSTDTAVYNNNLGKYSEEEFISLLNEKSYSAVHEKADFSLVQADDNYIIKFNQLFKDGIIYISINAISDAVLYGGYYSTEVDESTLNPVKLAIGICTFKREEAVIGNINRVLRGIINNSDSPLKDKVEVYIADNGQTLDVDQFVSDKIHILPNQNLGGVGGFTRTMIEAMFYDQAKDFTHIIFMDDDILLYPAVLERSFYLLQMLKPEYQKAILGAATVLLEKPYIQQESGALYRDKTFYIGRANHKFFDLRKTDAVAANEVVDPANYTGWWYACIPKTIINKDNLPMPFFIHYDDVEYSIRNIENNLLFINGICVWHPSPKGKNPFWMTYYDVRNRLITMFSKGVSKSDFKEYLYRLSKQFFLKAVRYGYEDAGLLLAGVKDFLKGPEEFARVDAAALHTGLLKTKDILFTPEEIGVSQEQIVERKYSNFKKAVIMQILCNILPAKKRTYAINSKYFNIPYRADTVYLYNEKIGKGNIEKRNQRKFFQLLFSFLSVRRQLKKDYKQMLHRWQSAKPTFTSLPFWEKYLGLHKDNI